MFLPCGFSSLFIFFLFSSPNLSGRRLVPYLGTWCGLSANLECRSDMCCARLAANTGRKKIAKKSPSGHHLTILLGYIFATKACIENRKKNLLSSNMSSTCPHNMDFGSLAAKICWRVSGTPAHFMGFACWQRYCAAFQYWA